MNNDNAKRKKIVKVIAEVLKIIFRLKNIRRAEGKAGRMTTFTQDVYGTANRMYVSDTGTLSPWPTSLTIIVSSMSLYYNMPAE